MIDKLKKIKENKALRIIGNILYTIFFIIVVLMLVVVVLQRVSENSISLGGIRLFSVATGSMIPKYDVGDILISKEIEQSQIQVGDDVVYKGEVGTFAGKVITHQVISITQDEDGIYRLITKGIANEEEDPEITGDQVYGKIIYKVHSLSYISKLIKNIYVFYFFIFIPIVLIIYKQGRNVVLSIQERNEEEEEDDDDDEEEKDGYEDNHIENDKIKDEETQDDEAKEKKKGKHSR